MMLVLRVLTRQPLHGYAIAQRIHQVSADELRVEEGSLYPALQKLLVKGWVTAAWRESESGRQVREYRITASGRRQLEAEMGDTGGPRAPSVCCWIKPDIRHGDHR